jgi:hypothetical protein
MLSIILHYSPLTGQSPGSLQKLLWLKIYATSIGHYNLVKSDISTLFEIFLFLSISCWLLEGFDVRGEAEGTTSIWACLFLNGQFHCTPHTLPVICALVMSSSIYFGEDPGGQS